MKPTSLINVHERRTLLWVTSWECANGVYTNYSSRIAIGYERYGEHSIALNQLLDVQFCIATIIGDLAIHCIIDHPVYTRIQVVRHVWNIIDNGESPESWLPFLKCLN